MGAGSGRPPRRPPPVELLAIVGVAAERGGVAYVDEIYGELVYDVAP